MIGTEVNQAAIRKGDSIATKVRTDSEGTIHVLRSHVVRHVSLCPGKPECVHLDAECYDTRFASVIKAEKK